MKTKFALLLPCIVALLSCGSGNGNDNENGSVSSLTTASEIAHGINLFSPDRVGEAFLTDSFGFMLTPSVTTYNPADRTETMFSTRFDAEDPAAARTTNYYDEQGRLSKSVYRTRTFPNDPISQSANPSTTSYTYDGHLLESISYDPSTDGGRDLIRFTHDELGRVVKAESFFRSESTPSSEWNRIYKDNGWVTTVNAFNGTVYTRTVVLNPNGEISSITVEVPDFGPESTETNFYFYDSDDRLSKIQYNFDNGQTVETRTFTDYMRIDEPLHILSHMDVLYFRIF